VSRFADFAAKKTRAAQEARVHALRTIGDASKLQPVQPLGNAWTQAMYDGPFHVWREPPGLTPAVSLVFVRSAEGNTGAENPADLGGGATDKHLLYEGLSRVAADAVLAGATTAAGPDVFFSVWHPELVALRESLGLARHPAQVIVTGRGCIDVDSSLIFNVPDVPVYVIGTVAACDALAAGARTRPWITILPMVRDRIRPALERLKTEHGIRRISAVGGRTTATSLVDAALVQDIYLTTTNRSAGQPDTPFYVGEARPNLKAVIRKQSTDPAAAFVFEHSAIEF
jgi:riboflavin biosynthesis pyrimidine reductase